MGRPQRTIVKAMEYISESRFLSREAGRIVRNHKERDYEIERTELYPA